MGGGKCRCIIIVYLMVSTVIWPGALDLVPALPPEHEPAVHPEIRESSFRVKVRGLGLSQGLRV